jgi:zinc-ribbon domain
MPKTCSQCQTENADEANNCSNCGAPLVAAAAATASPSAGPAVGQPAAAAASPAGAATGSSSIPAYKFDAARWSLADRICGIASFILFISLFLSWFSASLGPISVSASGLSVHGWLYVTLILCIAIIIYLALRAGWDEIPVSTKIPHLTVMMVATIVNLVLVFIAFIDKPGGTGFGTGIGWDFGAFLGLIAAVVAAAPYAIPQLRAKTM